MSATRTTDEVTLAEACEVSKPRRLARRYVCVNEGNEAAGLQHTSGNGTPTPGRKCYYCKGELRILHGLWGVFEWTGTGDYREEDAVRTYVVKDAADKRADSFNLTGPDGGPGGWVVRWIFKDAA